jgi:flagellar export protein FliJ
VSRTLKGLVRLRKWDVDEKRRFLANLLDSEAQVISLLRALEEQGKQERRAASADPMGAGITYGGYARWARGRREELESALKEIRQRIDAARDLLAEAFKELKTSEIAEENRSSRETVERQRRENTRQDDVGLEIFRRAEKKISLLTRKEF